MAEAQLIGIDLAKRMFQLHGATAAGAVVFRKTLRRGQLLAYLDAQPRCTVAMEACATAHDWGRAIERLGHTVRLLPPAYVKPYVKRQKNDAADAEAIAEAASRPTMRFVAVKTEAQQARAMIVSWNRGSCVLGVQAATTTRFSPFSRITSAMWSWVSWEQENMFSAAYST